MHAPQELLAAGAIGSAPFQYKVIDVNSGDGLSYAKVLQFGEQGRAHCAGAHGVVPPSQRSVQDRSIPFKTVQDRSTIPTVKNSNKTTPRPSKAC